MSMTFDESSTNAQTTPYKQATRTSEEFQRQKALQTSLDESNKGFRMLRAMGFKQQEWTEPIQINPRKGRLGLGTEDYSEQAKRRRTVQEKVRAEKHANTQFQTSRNAYRQLQESKLDDRLLRNDLEKSRRTCQDLDEKAGRVRTRFWPVVTPPSDHPVGSRHLSALADQEESESSDSDISSNSQESDASNTSNDHVGFEKLRVIHLIQPKLQLELVTDYLRRKYFYCIWCGAVYEDGAELEAECPGDTRADHGDDLE